MELTLAEQFIFLAQHRTKYYSVIGSAQRSVGLTGALLLQLFKKESLTLEDAHLVSRKTSLDLDQMEALVLERINASKKKRKIKHWIHRLYPKSEPWRKIIHHRLEKKGLFSIERRKFLFIPYTRVYITNLPFHAAFVNRIKEALEKPQEIPVETRQLLALIKATDMYKALSEDKKERKQIRKQLNALEFNHLVEGGVASTIREIEVAVMVSIMASTSAVMASTAASGASSN